MTFQEYYNSLNETYTGIQPFLEEIETIDFNEYGDKISILKANIKSKMMDIYLEIENVEENIFNNMENIDIKEFIKLSNLKDKILLQYNKLNSILENIVSLEIKESKKLIEKNYKEATNSKTLLIEAEKKQTQIQEQSKELSEKVEEEKNKIINLQKETEQKLKDIEHTTNNNILTFIGIFSSIITIITASISTTNSWLNNSNGSFILALFAPATIIVVAILVLFLLTKYVISDKKPKKGYIIASSIICGVLFAITVILAITINPKEKEKNCEDTYIIIPIKAIDNENNKVIYIYNGVEFTMECDYNLLHDDGLHYCTIHNKFE